MVFIPVAPPAHHEPPAPPPAINCDYQVKLNDNTWQCLTADQYNQRQIAEAQRLEQERADMRAWWGKYGWWVLGAFALIFFLCWLFD